MLKLTEGLELTEELELIEGFVSWIKTERLSFSTLTLRNDSLRF
jgi:hypothetical protein